MATRSTFSKYSKDVLIEYMFERFPLEMFREKDVARQLDYIKRQLDFDKTEKELAALYRKRDRLDKSKFKTETNYILARLKLDKKISNVLDRQSEIVLSM